MTALFLWSVLKTLKWALNTERDEIRNYIPWLYDAYKTFLLVILILAYGDGLAGWLGDAWAFALSLL